MENEREPSVIYFFEGLLDLLGLRDGVFPGVVLLSRRRWSGFPVDFAIGFGPGLSAMDNLLFQFKKSILRSTSA
jgi:hypothetical protein